MTISDVKPKRPSRKKVAATEALADADEDVVFEYHNLPSYRINLLSRFITQDYLNRIAETGIAPAQAYVLGELWHEEPLSQVELSRRLDIGKATIGQTLGRLERAGLINRFRIRDDRRVMMIELTDTGRNLHSKLNHGAVSQLRQLESILGKAELLEFVKMADKVIEGLRRDDMVLKDSED